jgi:ATP-dependent Clp protease adapter protein ClpS
LHATQLNVFNINAFVVLLQLKYILGYSVPRADKVQEQIHNYIAGIQGFVWQEYIMGITILT